MAGVSFQDLESAISEHEGCIRITCRVQPRASREALAGMIGNALKIALTAPPVEGKANAALCAFFAKTFKCPKSAVSKNKIVELQGISLAEVREKLL